jgi:phosphoribosylformylglycinamidine cyclo-ligase
MGATTLGQALLEPTRIYVKPLLALNKQVPIKAMAHNTGGGLPENLPRVLPAHTRAVVNTNSWTRPPVFDWLQQAGGIEDFEMLRTFNCGVGMILCVAAGHAGKAIDLLGQLGEQAWVLGQVAAGEQEEPTVELR